MPSSNSGGPWGNSGKGKGEGNRPSQNNGGERPPQVTDIDDLIRQGQDQLRNLIGGGGSGSNGGAGDGLGRGGWVLIILAAFAFWAFKSFYQIDTSERSVELLLGEYYDTGTDGLNFAPWPVVTYEKFAVTKQNTEEIGVGRDKGLMLTGDENIVNVDFQVVWNVTDIRKFLFNISGPRDAIQAVSESAMREIISRSQLAPILNKDRGQIAQELEELIQETLDSYDSGINIVRVNFDNADPPAEVVDAFREVQAAEQERDTLEKQADAYANRVVAEARGTAAQKLEEAEAYRAQVVNEAEGEASRFSAVYEEFAKAPEVTRKRLYLETLEKVLGDVDKVIIDQNGEGGSGVVPYLPLNELTKKPAGGN